jgi:acyl carrier protein
MKKEEIFAKVQEVLVETFELDEAQVVSTASLYADLDLDSLDAIDLAVRLGSETGIKLKEEQMRSIRTVQDIVEVVHQALNPVKSAQS